MRVHHIAIVVSDVERSLAFYRDVIGLPEIIRASAGQSKNPGAWLRLEQQLHLQGRAGEQKKSEQHFALVTDRFEQFEQIVARAPDAGGRIEETRAMEGFSRRCFVYDPDGNRIELLTD